MATTLVQYWQHVRDTHDAAHTAAQNDLASAQLVLVTAKAKLDADVAALQKLVTDVAANRAKLATTSVPSEVTALNNALRDQIILQRAMQGGIMDDQEAVAAAQADANAATNALNRAKSRLEASDAGLAAEKDANKQRQLLKSQLAAAPFDTIQADATAATASTAATDAKADIDANFPAELQTIAGKRHATRSARLVQLRKAVIDAETALGTTLAATSGLAGDAAQKGVAFRLADQKLRDYMKTAKQRYDRAIGVLADLQAMSKKTKTPDLLTKQEKLDVALSSARTTAEKNAEPLDANRKDVYTAQQALDAQIIVLIGKDVDSLAGDPSIKTARDTIAGKAATLESEQKKFVTSGDKKVLDEWQVVVQDSAWRTLIDYLDAMATLAELKATKPADLAKDLDDAEGPYADALDAAAEARRQADAFADVIALRTERVDASSAAFPGRLLSAVRGDSF